MTSPNARLHFLESERVLLGRHLARVAKRGEAGSAQTRAAPARAAAASSPSSTWLPLGGMVLLTLAMIAALLVPH